MQGVVITMCPAPQRMDSVRQAADDVETIALFWNNTPGAVEPRHARHVVERLVLSPSASE